MKKEHHNGTSKVGKKGSPNQPGGPAVSPTAHCAVKSNFVKFNFNFAKLESIETPQRGQLLGIVRPLWVKSKESECRAVWLDQIVRH